MPSDELRAAALDALKPAHADFRSALATTIEEVRSFLATRETSEEEHVSQEQDYSLRAEKEAALSVKEAERKEFVEMNRMKRY